MYQASKGNEKGIAAWIAAIQSDFAMRADWCIAPEYDSANHAPHLTISEGSDLIAEAGQTVVLHALAEDPDGDAVNLLWYHYPLGDTYEEEKNDSKDPIAIQIQVSDQGGTASFTVPEDAKSGDTLHIILEGIDQGGTNPRAYQRVIITVR